LNEKSFSNCQKANSVLNRKMSSALIKFEANLSAGNEIISIYCNNSFEVIRYVMLLAQMQSGKTFVYTFVMCEMFRRRKVEKVVIFSGNAEVALREQTRRCLEDSEFQIFYKEYLSSLGVQEEIIEDCWDGLQSRITRNFEVIWGTALKKRMAPKNKTLFIWDESHFAQDQGMCPDKFLDQMGILPNGDWRPLRERDNYVLSVSATSFSEASDAIHHDQCKALVTFSPSSAYMSIKKMKENGMIVPYESPRVCVLEQMRSSVSRVGQRKYGIIRIGHNVGEGNEDVKFYKMVAEKAKWDIKLYFETSELSRIDSLECLNHQPVKNTLILVKDHCRMGQQLPKQNMSFVIETAVTSRTDVLLQGLLGRMCGYHNFTGIRICLRESFVESKELDKYLQFVKKSNSGLPVAIPSKGNNIIAKETEDEKEVGNPCVCGYNHKGGAGSTPIIPIRITTTMVDGSEDLDVFTSTSSMNQEQINIVVTAIRDGRCEDFNSEDVKAETRNMINLLPEDSFHWVKRTLKESTAKIISEAIDTRSEKKLGSAAGIDFGKIGVFVAKESFQEYGIKKGSIFIFRQYLKDEPVWKVNIPKTTRKEVFCRMTENGGIIPSNGQCSEDLDPLTAEDAELMKNAILSRVERSLQKIEGLIISRNITSNKSVGSRWSGIYVTNEVLAALTKGGKIYEEVKTKHGLKLKCEKQRGKKVSGETMIRLIQISW
jgi:hypothetical protein